jgi:hypothetical protein
MIRNLPNCCKICSLIAVLLLPSLAYAEHAGINWGKDWGNDWDHRRDRDHKDPIVSAVPETNTGLVLIPVMGMILLVSSIRLLRTRKA